MPQRIDGVALGSVAAGSLLLYAGITGKSVPAALQAIIQGKSPASGSVVYPIQQVTQTSTAQATAGGTAAGTAAVGPPGNINAAIAAAAQASIGHAYGWGGAPGTDGKSPWDCSSAVNYWTAVDCHLAIPGFAAGAWTGTTHGPPTGSWLLWGHLQHVARKDVAAGDILVYQTHMGVAISNANMVSAETPSQGTQIAPIDDMTKSLGEILFCRRYPAGG